MKLIWNAEKTPEELHEMLRTFGEEYPVGEGTAGTNLVFEKADDPGVLHTLRDGEKLVVRYGCMRAAARGLAYALAGEECRETMFFKTFAVLRICFPGVVTVAHFKHWLLRVALLGYNMALLYAKDTYQVPGETYFGYMRGAYSAEEIREIDAFAQKLGIEIVACIQVLGHLEPVLRWAAYGKVRDTSVCIRVDEPDSYSLLEKMIRFWSDALSSRRIHLGMDETHDLGRGNFMDIHGYEEPFRIYNRHLGKICGICEKLHLKPMIWADMYFRYASKSGAYYDLSAEVPENVKAAIPEMVQLCYWDYYNTEKDFYAAMLKHTTALTSRKALMATGLWTWERSWYDHGKSEPRVRPCIDACRETGTDEIIFTMWGHVATCEFESAFAGMAWAADYANNGAADPERISAVYRAVCGTSYELQLKTSEIGFQYTKADGGVLDVVDVAVLWDDPLMGIVWHEYLAHGADIWEAALESYRKTLAAIAPYRDDKKAGYIDYGWNVCSVLVRKVDFRMRLLKAYEANDREGLRTLAEKDVPEIVEAIESLMASYREQWVRSCKLWGLEINQIRLAGLRERYREAGRRIESYLDGTAKAIEELEIKPKTLGSTHSRYHQIATGDWFI